MIFNHFDGWKQQFHIVLLRRREWNHPRTKRKWNCGTMGFYTHTNTHSLCKKGVNIVSEESSLQNTRSPHKPLWVFSWSSEGSEKGSETSIWMLIFCALALPLHHVPWWRDFLTLLHPTPYNRPGEEGGLLWLVTCQGCTGHAHWALRLPGSAWFQSWPPVICSPLSQARLGEPVLQGDADHCQAEQWWGEQVHLI